MRIKIFSLIVFVFSLLLCQSALAQVSKSVPVDGILFNDRPAAGVSTPPAGKYDYFIDGGTIKIKLPTSGTVRTILDSSVTTTNITEGSNLYFTDTRARTAIDGTARNLIQLSISGADNTTKPLGINVPADWSPGSTIFEITQTGRANPIFTTTDQYFVFDIGGEVDDVFGIYPTNNAIVPLTVGAPSGQSADLFQLKVNGSTLAKFNSSGALTTAGLTVSGFSTGLAHVDSSGVFTSSALATSDLPANGVTLAKIQQIATNSLLGRSTSGTGDPEVITVGSGLSLSGGTLSATGSSVSLSSVTDPSTNKNFSMSTNTLTFTYGSTASSGVSFFKVIDTNSSSTYAGVVNIASGSGSNAYPLWLTKTSANSDTGAVYLKIGGSEFAANYKHLAGFGYTDSTYTKSPVSIGAVTTSGSGRIADFVVYARTADDGSSPLEIARFKPGGALGLGGIGSTLGGFLDIAQGTITSAVPTINSAVTWNSGGTTFHQWQANVTDTASAAASTLIKLSVGNNVKFQVNKSGDLTLGRHLITSGSAPSVAVGADIGTGGSVSVSGNDTRCTVTITTGTGSSDGEMCTLTYNAAFGTAPKVTVTGVDQGAAIAIPYVIQADVTTTTVKIYFVNPPADGTAYKVNLVSVE